MAKCHVATSFASADSLSKFVEGLVEAAFSAIGAQSAKNRRGADAADLVRAATREKSGVWYPVAEGL